MNEEQKNYQEKYEELKNQHLKFLKKYQELLKEYNELRNQYRNYLKKTQEVYKENYELKISNIELNIEKLENTN